MNLRSLVASVSPLFLVAGVSLGALAAASTGCSAAPADGSDDGTAALDDTDRAAEGQADESDDGITADKDAGKKDSGVHTDAGSKLTWTAIYDEAFAPGTPGHCGNTGCHSITRGGFLCGKTASTCLSGMIKKGLLSTTNPAKSELIDPAKSPLRWVSAHGPMPEDNKTAEPKLASDIEAWLKGGASGI